MANAVRRRELHPVYRCTACGKVLFDGLTLHDLYCPVGGGRYERIGLAEDDDDDYEDDESASDGGAEVRPCAARPPSPTRRVTPRSC
jgi:hypothetical protein